MGVYAAWLGGFGGFERRLRQIPAQQGEHFALYYPGMVHDLRLSDDVGAVLAYMVPESAKTTFRVAMGHRGHGRFVTVADVIYLSGLKQDAAVVVLIPLILYGVRLIVSFVYGIFGFKEENIRSKIVPLLMVLAALVCLCI